MSSEAIGHVFRYAPYDGATFQLLLALADSANDQNDNEIWMAVTTMSEKARIHHMTAHKAIKRLVKDGWLEVVVPSEKGKIGRYRLVIDWDREIHFQYSKKNKSQTDTSPSPGNKSGAEENKLFAEEEYASDSLVYAPGLDIEPKGNQEETKHETNSLSNASHSTESVSDVEVVEAKIMTTQEMAHEIVTRHYDQQKAETGETPVWNFKGVRKIVKKFLDSGRSPEDVLYALNNTHAYTMQAILFTLNQHKKGGTKTDKTHKHNEERFEQIKNLGVDLDAVAREMGL